MRVRTRIAPSPTGDPHVGTAYVGLVNYCFAKKSGGDFLLRIEDTDQLRSTVESETAIFRALKWCGLSWNEGPDVGGPHAPYRQSERTEIYREHVELLLKNGHAFRCFCTAERLEEMRVAQRAAHKPPRYDGFCLNLSEYEINENLKASQPFVVRMYVKPNEVIGFKDELRGWIEFDSNTIDMQVLMKSDGYPTYHLANVVDDYLMRINNVIRGEEWISSTPKHILLYRYFDWPQPAFCHLPLLRNPDKSKLSKRRNPTGILYYRDQGYLPEALLNFLGILIDARNDEERLIGLSTAELLAIMSAPFELSHISPGGPVFDLEKLLWLNGQHIRRRKEIEFLQLLDDFGYEWPDNTPSNERKEIARLAQPRIQTLSEFEPLVAFLWASTVNYSAQDLVSKNVSQDDLAVLFDAVKSALNSLSVWDSVMIEHAVTRTTADYGFSFRKVARPFYVAITGSPTSIPLFDSMKLLGRERVKERLNDALKKLGVFSSTLSADLNELKELSE